MFQSFNETIEKFITDAERLILEQFPWIEFEIKERVNNPVEQKLSVVCQSTTKSTENAIIQYDDREKPAPIS